VCHCKYSSILYHFRDISLKNIITLKSRLEVTQLGNFGMIYTSLKSLDLGYLSAADSMGLPLFLLHSLPIRSYISYGALRLFKVMEIGSLPIESPYVTFNWSFIVLCACIISCIWRLIGRKSPFFAVLPTPVSFEAPAKGVPLGPMTWKLVPIN